MLHGTGLSHMLQFEVDSQNLHSLAPLIAFTSNQTVEYVPDTRLEYSAHSLLSGGEFGTFHFGSCACVHAMSITSSPVVNDLPS